MRTSACGGCSTGCPHASAAAERRLPGALSRRRTVTVPRCPASRRRSESDSGPH
jgi:hypothetical protein